ncbi:Hypothetical protein GSB_155272 [Giardia duodenalis]|uniref:Uncharacterized protein n=1 Tax=Giardia intestinalis TaxID=5741 RepID=V6TS59_GIAIN|nr:Hypothetical protein GSB_155272 [Giardia intestinalis]
MSEFTREISGRPAGEGPSSTALRILAPACASQFEESALQKLSTVSTVPATVRSEIQSEIRRYLDLGKS